MLFLGTLRQSFSVNFSMKRYNLVFGFVCIGPRIVMLAHCSHEVLFLVIITMILVGVNFPLLTFYLQSEPHLLT